ncbi:hypothetical protein D477_015883 [Arthrobacter crystallopoietes BAB-32]|uniref:Uncharacterized protein n=1 Tax=Arthrobacter crystallopoietes BAB-32 TaxID=1246476 RepID=N1US44_9MICC|nr:hypothetical protein [Arthrobacter crystallopoietes]EMY33226.1 hypothetical protein D477_015883 [Arthrobacter crystallopoietes BAB-32]
MTIADKNPDLNIHYTAAESKPDLDIHLAPSAAAKLSSEQQKRLADARSAKNPGDLPGWHSIGSGHKPTHASKRQGRGEKQVRW